VLWVAKEFISDKKEQEIAQKKEYSLFGTFLSVLMLALFLILSWFGVYYLFIQRL
jgi:hypothetical protein